MSNPSDVFECQWRPSRRLLALYLTAWLVALIAPWLSALPALAASFLNLLCVAHACWALPRYVLLSSAQAFLKLRKDAQGWQLWSRSAGWQPVQLRPESMALTQAIILRVRCKNRWLSQSVCIASDSLAPDLHRRLRVLLKFSRKRWVSPF